MDSSLAHKFPSTYDDGDILVNCFANFTTERLPAPAWPRKRHDFAEDTDSRHRRQ
jgi:hypothetical protein